MKKVLLLGLCCLCFCGCGEKKEEKKIDSKIENYLKENMPFGYMYREDKINVVDSHLTIYEIQQKDWLDCAFFSKSALESLTEKDISQIGIKSITFQCKQDDLKGKVISSVRIDNLSEFNNESFPEGATIYNENVKISENDLEIFKQSNSAKEAREKIKERDEEQKAKEEQEAKEKEEKEQKEFKDKCKSYDYKEIFRNSEKYIGEYAKFTGKVIQVQENGEIYSLRVNVTKDKYGYYDDTIMIIMYMNAIDGRILEDDIIEFYGKLGELTSYETVLGATVTIPTLYAQYANLNN